MAGAGAGKCKSVCFKTNEMDGILVNCLPSKKRQYSAGHGTALNVRRLLLESLGDT